MAGERQPLYSLSPDSHGPIVLIVSDALASTSTIITVIRFWHAATHKITLGVDDVTYLIANVCIPLSISLCGDNWR